MGKNIYVCRTQLLAMAYSYVKLWALTYICWVGKLKVDADEGLYKNHNFPLYNLCFGGNFQNRCIQFLHETVPIDLPHRDFTAYRKRPVMLHIYTRKRKRPQRFTTPQSSSFLLFGTFGDRGSLQVDNRKLGHDRGLPEMLYRYAPPRHVGV